MPSYTYTQDADMASLAPSDTSLLSKKDRSTSSKRRSLFSRNKSSSSSSSTAAATPQESQKTKQQTDAFDNLYRKYPMMGASTRY